MNRNTAPSVRPLVEAFNFCDYDGIVHLARITEGSENVDGVPALLSAGELISL